MKYWLVIADAGSPSIEDLLNYGSIPWAGVRDSEGRDLMTRRMAVSDRVLYVDARRSLPTVTGLMRVSAPSRPDPSQFDAAHLRHDPAATREHPLWYCVPMELLARAVTPVTLDMMRAEPALLGLSLLEDGPVRSVAPVEPGHFRLIVKLAGMRQRKETGG